MTDSVRPDPPAPGEAEASTPRERELALALAEFLDRQAGEETLDVDAFCHSHPSLSPELRSAIEALHEIDHLAASEIPPEKEHVWDGPEFLSNHRILREIGSGGMGRVWLAEDERLGRRVAIKVLSSRFRNHVNLRDRFMAEARALAKLSHPNIVQIYSLGGPDDPPHFVMEYLEGSMLTEAAKALPIEQKAELMHRVVCAVDFLHRHQIIHRDLKPGNILVGADLEPKLLDFGLARQMDERGRKITHPGEVMGTPHYFSPEQARADAPLDARSDVFSLGTILYELLTGVVPFRGETFSDQVRQICESHPTLPRRLNKVVPGDLQDVCMKALEKLPENRYGTAREMADDLERFLAGEKVLAAPASYTNLMAGKIEQHLRELDGWRQDHILSEYEFDALHKNYGRLIEREDAWIMEVRRLSVPQVSLYLGAWLLVVASALVLMFRYLGLPGTLAVLLVSVVTAISGFYGVAIWKQGRLRIAVAYLLAFCLLLPIGILVAMGEYRVLTGFSQGRESLELFQNLPVEFRRPTNAQMWWAIFLSLPAYLWLRRFTKSSVFSLVFAALFALLSQVTLLRLGLLDWAEKDPGMAYLHMIPIAMIFFFAAFELERYRYPADSRYFYPFAVLFTFLALSGLAGYDEDLSNLLDNLAPWTRGQHEYLFILNAGTYYVLQAICHAFNTAHMRAVAKVFRFVIPGHVMTSLLVLDLRAETAAEQRTLELTLLVVAAAFVFWSIPKQMKNYLASGLLFLAITVFRLQYEWLRPRAEWPIALLIAGTILMIVASRYAPIRMTLTRWLRRKP